MVLIRKNSDMLICIKNIVRGDGSFFCKCPFSDGLLKRDLPPRYKEIFLNKKTFYNNLARDKKIVATSSCHINAYIFDDLFGTKDFVKLYNKLESKGDDVCKVFMASFEFAKIKERRNLCI